MREKVERRDTQSSLVIIGRILRGNRTASVFEGTNVGTFGGLAKKPRGCRIVDLSRLRLNNSACERRLSTTCAWLTADSALSRPSGRLVSFSISSFPASTYFNFVSSPNAPSSFSPYFLSSLPLSSHSLLLPLLRHPPPPDSPPPPEPTSRAAKCRTMNSGNSVPYFVIFLPSSYHRDLTVIHLL